MFSDGTLKIVDFGASKKFNPKKGMKNFHGTSYYIAPEVLEEQYTEKCDVWSCGVILYILLTGRPPFNGANDEQILKAVKRGKFSLEGAEFRNVSSKAKALLKKMLCKDPNLRPSVEECLKDDWFSSLEEQSPEEKNDELRSALENLKGFQTQNKFQRSVYFFMVSQMLTKEEESELMLIFKQLDTNGDGVLSKEELRKGFEGFKMKSQITNEEIDRIINQIDVNNNNNIDYSEFVAATLN